MPIHTNAGHASALRNGWCERHSTIVAGIDSPSSHSAPVASCRHGAGSAVSRTSRAQK